MTSAKQRRSGSMSPTEVDEEDTGIPPNSQQISNEFNIVPSLNDWQQMELNELLV